MGKVVLITGATTGIGHATAKVLVDAGCKVYGTGRNVEHDSCKDGITYLKMDVRDASEIERAVQLVIQKEDRIDVLFSNAGIGVAGPIEEFTREEIQEAFQVNFFGAVNVIQKVVPHMRNQKEGIIIQTSSIAGELGLPFQGIYSSTKYALEGALEALRMELSPFGIKVCLLQPGDFKTNVNTNRRYSSATGKSHYQRHMEHFYKLISENIHHSDDPHKVGQLILKIMKQKRVKPRYRIGPFTQIITPKLKNILPDRLFESLLMSYYKLK